MSAESVLLCRACGIDNPEDSSFCRECGTSLKAPAPAKHRPFAATMVSAGGGVPETDTAARGSAAHGSAAHGGAPQQVTAASARVGGTPYPKTGSAGTGGHRIVNGGVAAAPSSLERERPSGVAPRGYVSPESERPAPARSSFPPPPTTPSAAPPGSVPPAPRPAGFGRLREEAPPRALPPFRNCPRCEGVNSPEARFCQLCGLALTSFEVEDTERLPVSPSPVPGRLSALPVDACLVVIGQDGAPGRRYPLTGPSVEIGRESGDIRLERDPYVCPLHARITYGSGGFAIEDLGSVNGVYVRLGTSPVELRHGDLLLLGQAVLRFEIVEETERSISPAVRDSTRVFGTPAVPRRARLVVHTVEGCGRDIFYLSRPETILGREAGDIVFTDDPFMSRRHGALRRASATNTYTLRDLGSSNGTFIAIRRKQPLSPGDHVRIGQHLFRLDVQGSGSS